MTDPYAGEPTGEDGRVARRAKQRKRLRRQRRQAALGVLALAAVIVGTTVMLPRFFPGVQKAGTSVATTGSGPTAKPSTQTPAAPSPEPSSAYVATPSVTPSALLSDTPAATPSPTPTKAPSAAPTHTPKPKPKPTVRPAVSDGGLLGAVRLTGGFRVVEDLVPFGTQRKQEMAAYSLRHYGQNTWKLTPRAIVLHFTAGSTYGSAHNYFVADTPNRGELPGASSHFIIDKDGTIYQQVSTAVRTRHAVGLNWAAIGIEFVQETGSSSHWADRQILDRSRQIHAGLALVAFLCSRYHISPADVMGHATANSSRFFKDLKGWTNTHTDWQAQDVATFRTLLASWRKSH